MDTKNSIAKRYSREIQNIHNKLRDLEKGRIYEFSKSTGDGYLATNIVQLRKMIDELIDKIDSGEESINEHLRKVTPKI